MLNKSKLFVFSIFFIKCKFSMKLDNVRCYECLGCINYTSEWTHKQYRPNNILPADRHAVNTIFVLWNLRDSNLISDVIGTNPLYAPKINKSLKLLVHDFTSNGYTGWIQYLATTLLSYHNTGLSIISVDWAAGAEPPYIQAISNARLVALEIVHFLRKLKIVSNLKMENVHVVGHGVGAHIAGYVGKINRLKRITALDPSGLYFEHMPHNVHLHRDDAQYVEVLHTDATIFSQGSKACFGHADFFANGGRKQPGCKDSRIDIKAIKRDHLRLGQILPGCSHKRSLKYYIETVINESCAFLGIKCTSYKDFLNGRCATCGANMEHCLRINAQNPPRLLNEVHRYYFVTSSSPPFCGEMIKINIFIKSSSSKQLYVNGYFNITIQQSLGDVNFLVNENSKTSTLRTNKQHSFLVFRTTPPPLVPPINTVFLKWHRNPIPSYWCAQPGVIAFMIQKLPDDRKEKSQWFCAMNTSGKHKTLERQLEPCRNITVLILE